MVEIADIGLSVSVMLDIDVSIISSTADLILGRSGSTKAGAGSAKAGAGVPRVNALEKSLPEERVSTDAENGSFVVVVAPKLPELCGEVGETTSNGSTSNAGGATGEAAAKLPKGSTSTEGTAATAGDVNGSQATSLTWTWGAASKPAKVSVGTDFG